MLCWSVFISGGNAHSVVETRAFLLVVIAGLWYVKWQPYYGKALLLPKPTVSVNLSLRRRMLIVAGGVGLRDDLFPRGMESGVLGVILGSLIQVLIPRDWLLVRLGNRAFAARCWERCFRCRHDVYLLCGSGRGGNASPTGTMGGALAFWMGNPLLNPATLCLWGLSSVGNLPRFVWLQAFDGVADCDAGTKMGT